MIVTVYPHDVSEPVRDALEVAGAETTHIDDLDLDRVRLDSSDALVVELGAGAMRQLREVRRIEETLALPVLLVATSDQMVLVESSDVEADFVLAPVDPIEFRIRLRRLSPQPTGDETIRFKDLELNPLTYQATLAGEPMDLTYMEYELLLFLVDNPVRVWSREQLLSRVWGYDYYGGARTVDVHVRRLRSKLGEERSSWISTVRSVGYRWG